MYWSRADLKAKAKQVMRGSYLPMLLVSLILIFFGGEGSAPSFSIDFSDGDFLMQWDQSTGLSMISGLNQAMLRQLFVFGFIAIIAALVFLLVKIFVGYNLIVGCRRYFLGLAQGVDMKVSIVGSTFYREVYGNVFVAMLLRDVFTFLWTLLLIIPGIIKSYAYSMTSYILADNPNISPMRAIELSKQMTRGEKWSIFVLDLSFIGWYLLGLLAFVVGMVCVYPYVNATKAELYLTLREKAIREGLTDAEELNLAAEPMDDER